MLGAEMPPADSMKEPVRVMIVGDSMTQGGEGDYTWRYRLWEWVHDQEINFTFVGPYKGTQEAGEPSPPKPPPLYKTWDQSSVKHHGGYAKGISAEFDSHHYSSWGWQCAQAKDLIEETMNTHPPDLLLVLLGFNDVGWFVSDAKGTIVSMEGFVKNARRANPKVKLAIANIPQRTEMGGREDLPIKTTEYNELLVRAISEWNEEASPIYLVKVCEEYTAETASFDGLHPNALGDYQIAKAFSLTLMHDLGLGSAALRIPNEIPARPLPTPSNFQFVSSPAGVTATWDQVYGANGYEMRSRTNDGEFSTGGCGGNRWDSHWCGDGTRYEAQVRSFYGTHARSNWTPLLAATAHPQLAPAPSNIVVRSAKAGVVVTWDPPDGPFSKHIVQYSVLWKDKDKPNVLPGMGGFKQSPAHIDELEDGHTYDIGMLTWNTAGEGFPGPMQEFTVDNSSPSLADQSS